MVKKNNLKVLMVAGLLAVSQASMAFAGVWKQDSTGWWYQNDNGTYKTNEWFQDTDGSWYYLNPAGYTHTNCWQQINGAWYYFDASGRMLANKWEWVDGNKDGTAECYLFSPTGAAYMNTATPDGYIVDINGAWIVDGTPQTKSVSVGPGGTNTGTTTKTTSFSSGGSGGSGGGGGGSSSGGGGGSSYSSSNRSFTNGNRSMMTSDQWNKVTAAIEAFKEEYITDDMSDFEKEIKIVEWLVANSEYDQTTSNCSTAYGCIIEGKAKCMGYADAFLQTAKLCGLDVRYVYNSSIHDWNLINLDGEWYHVDVTWEDPVGSTNNYGFNNLRCKYINLTDSEIKDTYAHKSWYPTTIKATGTKYGKSYVTDYMKKDETDDDTETKTDYSKETYETELPKFYEDACSIESDYTIKTDKYSYDDDDELIKEINKDLKEIKEKGVGTYTFVLYSDDRLSCKNKKCHNATSGYAKLSDQTDNELGYTYVDNKRVKNYTITDCTDEYKIYKPSYAEKNIYYSPIFYVIKITYEIPENTVANTITTIEYIVDNSNNTIEDTANISNNSNNEIETTVENSISDENSEENTKNDTVEEIQKEAEVDIEDSTENAEGTETKDVTVNND